MWDYYVGMNWLFLFKIENDVFFDVVVLLVVKDYVILILYYIGFWGWDCVDRLLE